MTASELPMVRPAAPSRAMRLGSMMRRLLRRRDGFVGLCILVFFSVIALFPDLLVGPLQTPVTGLQNGYPRLAPPSLEFPLGTDELRRSMLNLVVHGARVSMVIGLLATVITVVIGALLGVVSGFVGGATDSTIMRVTDFFLVIPTFVLAIILTSLIRDVVGTATTEILGIRMTLIVIVVVIGVTSWASTARIIRSQTLSLKERAFVDRARVVGAGGGHIMRRHIGPNVVNLIVANAVLVFAGAVLTETTLSFIGLGDPLQPSWGQILESSRVVGAPSLGAWWYFVPAGACIVLVVFAFTLLGTALDSMLNPKQRARR
jgi:peptide/nickel transport system permease protein